MPPKSTQVGTAQTQIPRAKTIKSRPSKPRSRNSTKNSNKSLKTRSSASNSASVNLLGCKAALEVEAAAMEERLGIEQQILQLHQQAKRHDIKTEIDTLEAGMLNLRKRNLKIVS